MKIIVTGGAGFIGSHIVDLYVSYGHKVTVIDNLSKGKKENINPKAKFIKVDIRDKNLYKIFLKEKPDIVNHHAAQVSVAESVRNPVYDADVNIYGSLNVFESSCKANVDKIIFASSGGVIYGEVKGRSAKETDPEVPVSPYGVSKLAGEKYLRFLSRNYVSLRYGNVYGPRQDPYGEAGVIAIFISSMLDGKTPTINGDGNYIRDYVYCKDVAYANLVAIKKNVIGEFNVGTGRGISVNELFKRTKKIIGINIKPKYGPHRPGDLRRSIICSNLLKKKLGWKIRFPLEKGLKETIASFK